MTLTTYFQHARLNTFLYTLKKIKVRNVFRHFAFECSNKTLHFKFHPLTQVVWKMILKMFRKMLKDTLDTSMVKKKKLKQQLNFTCVYADSEELM